MSETKPRRAPVKKAVVVVDANAETVSFHEPLLNESGEGNKWLPGALVLCARLGDLPPNLVTRAALHGINQKLADRYAGPEKSVVEVVPGWEQLLEGDWDAGSNGLPDYFAEAYAHVKGKEVPEIRTTISRILAGGDEAKIAHLRGWATEPRIVAAIAKIKAVRAAERAKAAAVAAKAAPAGELEDLV